MLYTRISWVNFIKLSQQLLAYCLLMNFPVAPESTRGVMDLFSAVLVVLTSTFNFSEFGVTSVVAIMNFSGNAFSHFGFHTLGTDGVGVLIGIRISSIFCMSRGGVLELDIFANILKQLHVDNEGVLSLVVLYKILFFWNLMFHSHQKNLLWKCILPIHHLHLKLLNCQQPYIESLGAVQSFVSRLMAPITSWWSWVPFSSSVDVHRYWAAQSWVNLSCWRDPEETLLNRTEGSGCGTGGSGCRDLVSQFEGFTCCTVFVYIFCCVIPVFWGSS